MTPEIILQIIATVLAIRILTVHRKHRQWQELIDNTEGFCRRNGVK